MTTSILNLTVILKVTKETEDRGVCSNSVTLRPEIIVTICPDTVSLAKHAITKNTLQIPFNGFIPDLQHYTHNHTYQ